MLRKCGKHHRHRLGHTGLEPPRLVQQEVCSANVQPLTPIRTEDHCPLQNVVTENCVIGLLLPTSDRGPAVCATLAAAGPSRVSCSGEPLHHRAHTHTLAQQAAVFNRRIAGLRHERRVVRIGYAPRRRRIWNRCRKTLTVTRKRRACGKVVAHSTPTHCQHGHGPSRW